jgi:hypothetical protein
MLNFDSHHHNHHPRGTIPLNNPTLYPQPTVLQQVPGGGAVQQQYPRVFNPTQYTTSNGLETATVRQDGLGDVVVQRQGMLGTEVYERDRFGNTVDLRRDGLGDQTITRTDAFGDRQQVTTDMFGDRIEVDTDAFIESGPLANLGLDLNNFGGGFF